MRISMGVLVTGVGGKTSSVAGEGVGAGVTTGVGAGVVTLLFFVFGLV